MIRTRGRRPLACHHEAGHAVARWWLGLLDYDRWDASWPPTPAQILAGFLPVRERKAAA